ncbi:hypothetical protein SEVIR_8G041301v4 [Setaria viridis]|uniref:Uncharacterized protein n=1 Tax=Setaria viridis TaxID=4556 RepID=A0A4U6TEI0_SETVI|nr:hypothetical protein SEVIR_8G041301v2 [Setaria viridis]
MKQTADKVTALLMSLATAAAGYGSCWGRRHQRYAAAAKLDVDLHAPQRLRLGKEASEARRRLQARRARAELRGWRMASRCRPSRHAYVATLWSGRMGRSPEPRRSASGLTTT